MASRVDHGEVPRAADSGAGKDCTTGRKRHYAHIPGEGPEQQGARIACRVAPGHNHILLRNPRFLVIQRVEVVVVDRDVFGGDG